MHEIHKIKQRCNISSYIAKSLKESVKKIKARHTTQSCQKSIGGVAKHNRLDSRTGQSGHSVVTGSPPLRRFFGAVLLRR